MATVIGDLHDLLTRITASADHVRDLEERLATERSARNDLIVTAIDEAGLPQRDVAHAAGLGQSHILRILSRSSDD